MPSKPNKSRRPPFVSSYTIVKTKEGKYRILFAGDVSHAPPSYAYWLGDGKFLQTAAFTTPQMAQLFRHNHLDILDRKALGYRAFADTNIYEYGRVTEYPLEHKMMVAYNYSSNTADYAAWQSLSRKPANRNQREKLVAELFLARGERISSVELARRIDLRLGGERFSTHTSGPQSTTVGTVEWLLKNLLEYKKVELILP